jgi:nucleoside-diphosphate-sugar epimerase
VTGGAGFIGSTTVGELVRRGHSVCVLDDLSAGCEKNLAQVRDKIDFIRGSVNDRETVDRACRGADYVLHLAARTSVPLSVEDPLGTNHINVNGTLVVLLAARDARGFRGFVFGIRRYSRIAKTRRHDSCTDLAVWRVEAGWRTLREPVLSGLRFGVCVGALL